jgi:hypothetical protein
VLSIALVASISGCGGLRGSTHLEPILAHEADDVARLMKSRWLPREAPPIQPASVPKQTFVDAAVALARPVDDVPTEYAWKLVGYACEAADMIEAGESPATATIYLAAKVPNMEARIKAQELRKNLSEANNSGDVAYILGKTLLCESASHR